MPVQSLASHGSGWAVFMATQPQSFTKPQTMKYLLLITMTLFTTAAQPSTNNVHTQVYIPAVTHGHVSRGTHFLDCPPDAAGTVSWFFSDGGVLSTNWIFLSVIPGEFKAINREVIVPKRGVVRATMDPRPDFFLNFMTWRFAGTAVLLRATCEVGLPSA